MGNRSNVRAAAAFVFIVASLGAAFGACTQYKSYVGDACLKDEDCIAGSCIAGLCALPPPVAPVTDARAPQQVDAAEAGGGGGDDAPSGNDSGDDGPAGSFDAGKDSTVEDSGHDASDAADAADASNDVSTTPDAADDAADADDDATGAREMQPDSLPA